MAADTNEFVEELTRPVIKLLVALIGLVILRFIITRLPGLDTLIPGTSITFAVLAAGIITLIMVAIIVNFGREIEPRLERTLKGPIDVTSDMAMVAKHLIFLLGVIVAYDGLDTLLIPFLVPDPGAWLYDIAFLLLALVPTAVIAQRMFTNLEEITDLLTEQVKSATVSKIECSECHEVVRASLDFCPNCGTEIDRGDDSERIPTAQSICSECGSDIDSDASFCGNCGTDVSANSTSVSD